MIHVKSCEVARAAGVKCSLDPPLDFGLNSHHNVALLLALEPEARAAQVSASHRGCSPPFCLAAENKQSSNQQRTFPPETSRHPSRAPHGPQQSLFIVYCLSRVGLWQGLWWGANDYLTIADFTLLR